MTTHDLWIFERLGSASRLRCFTYNSTVSSKFLDGEIPIVHAFYFVERRFKNFRLIKFFFFLESTARNCYQQARQFVPSAKLLNARIMFSLN